MGLRVGSDLLSCALLLLEQHKLTVSPVRPQQEVSPNRRSAHESRSEPTLSPKRQVYVEERDKAAAARASLVIEKLQRTEESELDEDAILDNRDMPEIDFAYERDRSEGEVNSDEEATSAMEVDQAATTSQRTPEISDITEFPEVHRVNRTRKRVQPVETPAVLGRISQSDPIHGERQPYDLDLEYLSTLKLPKVRPDTSSYQEFTKLTAINFSYPRRQLVL